MSRRRMPPGDPFPEAVDHALAEAVLGNPRVAGDPPDNVAPEALDPADLVALWRDVDAALLVQETVPTSTWTDDQVVQALATAERTARAATARGLRLAHELATRRPGQSQDVDEAGLSKYAVDEVAFATGLARGAALRRVAQAQALAVRHPRLLDALEAGLMAPAGLHKVAELCWELGEDSARRIEATVLSKLGRPFLSALGSTDLTGMLSLEPETARSLAARATTLRLARLTKDAIAVQRPRRERSIQARERSARRVGLDLAAGGMAWLSIYAPQELATAAYDRLTDHAKALDDPTDDRTMDHKRADVAMDLMLGIADHAPGDAAGGQSEGDVPAGGWGATTVNLDVIVDHSRCPGPSISGRGAGCVVEAGRLGPVTASSLADLLGLTLDSGGVVSGGHAVETPCPGPDAHARFGPGPYEPGAALRRFVRATWRRCVFPGCSRPARRCELDHTKRYRDGGATCRCNLRPLCTHHHHLKHDLPSGRPGWRLTADGDRLTWVSPTGLVVHVTPDPTEDLGPPPRPVLDDPPPF